MNPLVSVVVPTYNGEAFVRETLDSILAQRYAPCEVLVCDDGSNDGTLAILESYGERIRVLHQQHRGVAAARNRAASEARGEFLAFLDHDDVWEPHLLSTLVPILVARGEVGLVYADAWVIDAAGAVRGRRGSFLRYAEGRIFADLLGGNFIPVETTLLRTALFHAVGGCDEGLRYLEDYELCLRIARQTEVAFHAGPLARYRVHARNLSHDLEPMLLEWIQVLDRLQQGKGALDAEQSARVDRERARLQADLAWRALRRGDVAAADEWIARSRGAAPLGLRARVRTLRTLLRVLPGGMGRALLDRLPRRRLYGVSAEGPPRPPSRADAAGAPAARRT